MTRRLLNLLTLLSLLLCVAVVALWVRSYRAVDTVTWAPRGGLFQTFTMPGRLYLRHSSGTWSNGGGVGHTARPADAADRAYRWQAYADRAALGVGYRYLATGASGSHEITVPLWYLLASGALAPALAAARFRARKRRVAGLCPACGYDLRATPDRCPECGHTPRERPRETPPAQPPDAHLAAAVPNRRCGLARICSHLRRSGVIFVRFFFPSRRR